MKVNFQGVGIRVSSSSHQEIDFNGHDAFSNRDFGYSHNWIKKLLQPPIIPSCYYF